MLSLTRGGFWVSNVWVQISQLLVALHLHCKVSWGATVKFQVSGLHLAGHQSSHNYFDWVLKTRTRLSCQRTLWPLFESFEWGWPGLGALVYFCIDQISSWEVFSSSSLGTVLSEWCPSVLLLSQVKLDLWASRKIYIFSYLARALSQPKFKRNKCNQFEHISW